MPSSGIDIADQLAEDGGNQGSYHHQLQAVAQHLVKLRIDQHARFAVENFLYALAGPVVEGQVGQAEITQFEHQALQNQDTDGQKHRACQEYE